MFLLLTGTIYEMCRPGGHTRWQRSIYTGHKKSHGFKFQGVVSPDGIVLLMQGPFAARHHDMWIYKESLLEETMMSTLELTDATRDPASVATHWSIYGDPAYKTLPVLQCPITSRRCASGCPPSTTA